MIGLELIFYYIVEPLPKYNFEIVDSIFDREMNMIAEILEKEEMNAIKSHNKDEEEKDKDKEPEIIDDKSSSDHKLYIEINLFLIDLKQRNQRWNSSLDRLQAKTLNLIRVQSMRLISRVSLIR